MSPYITYHQPIALLPTAAARLQAYVIPDRTLSFLGPGLIFRFSPAVSLRRVRHGLCPSSPLLTFFTFFQPS
jgi:hypothetical protein